jgi:transposase InsO family protein
LLAITDSLGKNRVGVVIPSAGHRRGVERCVIRARYRARYRDLLAAHGILCSMSRAGDCYDNAAMESFWGTLKTELVHHERYVTREEARRSITRRRVGWFERRPAVAGPGTGGT